MKARTGIRALMSVALCVMTVLVQVPLVYSGQWSTSTEQELFNNGFEGYSHESEWSSAQFNGGDPLSCFAAQLPKGGATVSAPTRMTIAGLPNVFEPDVVTVTAGSEGSDMLAENLKDWQHPTQLAELDSIFPHESWWEVDAGPTAIENVGVIGAGNLYTLRAGDEVRMITVESGSLPAVRSATLPPTNTEAATNVVNGDFARVDDHPSTPDGTTIVGSGTGNWSVRFSFGTPASPPALGDKYQCFLLWVEHTSAGPDDHCTVQVNLYENGVFRQDLGQKAMPTGESVMLGLMFSWDASNLVNSNGSGVEIEINVTRPNLAVLELDSVSWEVLYESDRVAADYDTGWKVWPGADLESDFGDTAQQEVDTLPPIFRHFPADSLTVSKARIEFRADGLGYFTSFLQTPPRTVPATFIDAGYLILHPLWIAPFQFADGGELDTLPQFVGDEFALDGSSHRVIQYERRIFTVQFDYMSKSKADALFRRLNRTGQARAMLVSLFPDNGDETGDLYTMLATADRLSPHVMTSFSRDSERTSHSFQCTFVEHLG